MVAVGFALRSEDTPLSNLLHTAGVPPGDPALQTVETVLPGRTLGDLAQDVANLEDLHSAAKLGLLRDAVASLRSKNDTTAQIRGQLDPLARVLISPETQAGRADAVVAQLFDDLEANPTGEPLGRVPADLGRVSTPDADEATLGSTSQYLVSDARDTLLSDGCSMVSAPVDGQPGVLEIVGDMYAVGDLATYEPVIDPAQWPNCVISGLFFRHMTRLASQAASELAGPDAGYHARFEETVDFSLGLE